MTRAPSQISRALAAKIRKLATDCAGCRRGFCCGRCLCCMSEGKLLDLVQAARAEVSLQRPRRRKVVGQ